MNDQEKCCAIVIDEMSLKESLVCNASMDMLCGKSCLCIHGQGLSQEMETSNWPAQRVLFRIAVPTTTAQTV